MAQLRAFTAAAALDDRERAADFAVAARMAMGANPAEWQMYLASLRGQKPNGLNQGARTNG